MNTDPSSVLEILLASGTGAIIAGSLTLLNSWYQDKLKKRPQRRTRTSLSQVAAHSLYTEKNLYKLRDLFGAKAVTLSRFFNGQKFIDGFPLDKFLTTHKVTDPNRNLHLSGWDQALLSQYTGFIQEILFKNRYVRLSIDGIEDTNLRNLCLENNVHSVYAFLIKDLDNFPIGFLTMFFEESTLIEEESFREVYKIHNDLLNSVKEIRDAYNSSKN